MVLNWFPFGTWCSLCFLLFGFFPSPLVACAFRPRPLPRPFPRPRPLGRAEASSSLCISRNSLSGSSMCGSILSVSVSSSFFLIELLASRWACAIVTQIERAQKSKIEHELWFACVHDWKNAVRPAKYLHCS
jgi:hypothetical protein